MKEIIKEVDDYFEELIDVASEEDAKIEWTLEEPKGQKLAEYLIIIQSELRNRIRFKLSKSKKQKEERK